MPCNSTGKMYTSTLIVILEGTIQKINSFSVILFDKKPPLQESRFCARTHASPHADDPHLFLFLLITDDPCLVLIFFDWRNSLPGGVHWYATICSAATNNLTLALLFLVQPFLEGTLEGACFFGRLHVPDRSIARQRGLDW